MEFSHKKIDHYHFDPLKTIGEGAFGTVHLARDLNNNDTEVAVKVIPLSKIKEDPVFKEMVEREIDILKQLKSEYIVKFLDARRSDHNLYIFMEYCDGGTLQDKIRNDPTLAEDEICIMIKQIAHAFLTVDQLELHDDEGRRLTIMHRDIKLTNILLHKGKVKLADFGFAKTVVDYNRSVKLKHTLVGTATYMSPQILNNEKYSTKCDVWSTGVLFYRLLYGVRPWEGKSDLEIYNNIKTKSLEFPIRYTTEIEDLLTKMLKVEESDRLSWWGVYSHPALSSYKVCYEFLRKTSIAPPGYFRVNDYII